MDGIDISLVSTNGEKLTRGNKIIFINIKTLHEIFFSIYLKKNHGLLKKH